MNPPEPDVDEDDINDVDDKEEEVVDEDSGEDEFVIIDDEESKENDNEQNELIQTCSRNRDDYYTFDSVVNNEGGACWTDHKTVTDDGFELTLFRIVGAEWDGDAGAIAGSKGPLIMIHGYTGNSHTWWDRTDNDALAAPVQLYQQGYDVYLTNTRGTKYSSVNELWDDDQEAYWAWDFLKIAESDLEANVRKVMEVNGSCTKASIVGMSQGSQHMLLGLSRSNNHDDYISQGVALAPCVIPNTSMLVGGGLTTSTYSQLSLVADLFGIDHFFGDDWKRIVNLVCVSVWGYYPYET